MTKGGLLMKSAKRSVLIMLTALFLLLASTAAANAEERKDEWKQRDYPFNTIKLVLLQVEFGEKVQLDDLKQRILKDKVADAFSTNLRFAQAELSFLSQDELTKKLTAVNGEDYAAMSNSDPAKYAQAIKDGAAFYCQGVLKVRIVQYYDTIRHIPEHIETYETTKQAHINKVVTASNGSQVTINEWVSVPVTEARVVPARDESTMYTSVEFTLLDAKTGQPIWKMIDSRDALEKDKDGMVTRTLQRAAEKVEALKK